MGLTLLASGAATAGQTPVANAFTGRVDIGGRKIYLECAGTGRPSVVLEAGYHVRADYWSNNTATPPKTSVLPGIAAFTHVCAYDRPGVVIGVGVDQRSRSDTVPMPRSAVAAVNELHSVIHSAHIPLPVVLVGHSFGGAFTLLYAYMYPKDVAGLVLVDALVDLRGRLTPAQYKTFIRFNTERPKELDSYAGYETIAFGPAFDALHRLQAAGPLHPMPLIVITRALPVNLPATGVPAGFSSALERAWRLKQNQLAKLVPGARQIIAQHSEHYIMLTQPDLITSATRAVVDAVRRGERRLP